MVKFIFAYVVNPTALVEVVKVIPPDLGISLDLDHFLQVKSNLDVLRSPSCSSAANASWDLELRDIIARAFTQVFWIGALLLGLLPDFLRSDLALLQGLLARNLILF